jgi:hypothetical protein
MSANARWLAVVLVVIVVLGIAYAVYKRNTTAVEDYNTTNIPMTDTATTVPSTTMPGAAPGSLFEVSSTTGYPSPTDTLESPNGMAPATTP